jgi:hypothetical protein
MHYAVSGRTSSVITAMLSVLLALGMHLASPNRPHTGHPAMTAATAQPLPNAHA